MMKVLMLLMILFCIGFGREIAVIVHKDFPKEHLSVKTIQAIYLKKRRFIADKKLLPINYPFDNALRECFEKRILKKSRHALERYWRRAHYQGKNPPKVLASEQMLLQYMENIEMVIGYVEINPPQNSPFKVVYKAVCP